MFAEGQCYSQPLWRCATILPATSESLSGRIRGLNACCRPLTVEAPVRFQAKPCGICGEQSDTGTGFYWHVYV